MADDAKLQRGLLLAEIEQAEAELKRLCDKAAWWAASLREVSTILEEMCPARAEYQHEAAHHAALRERVRTQSKYKDAMNFESAMVLIAEIETAKRSLSEMLTRKNDASLLPSS